MTTDVNSLIDQFNVAFGKMPSGQQLSVQRQVVGLFLDFSTAYSEQKSAIFERLMQWLIERGDRQSVLELSRRLAMVDNAPAGITAYLASHHDIAVAAPVLEVSKALTDECLASIAKTNSQNHLCAIASRKGISETVTDALIERGYLDAIHKAVENAGAHFSEFGFAKMVQMARRNKALESVLADRMDLPSELRPFLRIRGS
jgi:uncharacterized protein (DUF2336 family)